LPGYLLDTNHLAYIQRQEPTVLAHIRRIPADMGVSTTVVAVAELLGGVYRLPESRRRRELMALYHEAMSQMSDVLPITVSAAERFAAIEAELRRRGTPIPTNDLWVAAVALDQGAILVTHDAHFRHVAGLQVEDWTQEP
jgi:tRNA(fMet)-specific endonuclease VapC